MYCWNCGMDNPEGSKVCAACGNPLSIDDIDLLLNISSARQQNNAAQSGNTTAVLDVQSGDVDAVPVMQRGNAAAAEIAGATVYPAYNDNTGGVDAELTNQYVQEILSRIGAGEETVTANTRQAAEQKARAAAAQQTAGRARNKTGKTSGDMTGKTGKHEKAAKQKKHTGQEESEAVQRAMQRRTPEMSSAEAVSYEVEETEGQTPPERRPERRRRKHSALKSVIIVLVILLLLAGAALVLYFLRTDTITAISAEAVSAESVQVTVNSINGSSITVVATAPDGTTTEVPVENNQAVFTGLKSDTTYSFMAESGEGKLLLGNRAAEATTTDTTHLNGFDVLNVTATTAELSLYGTGTPPERWIITVTAADGEAQTFEETETQFTLEGLTPGTTYAAEVSRNDGDVLDGVTSCSFSTLDYTVLETFEETDMTTDSISLRWSSTGTKPESWTLTWEGTDGSSESTELDGGSTYTTIDSLNAGVSYTVTISCPSMQENEESTLIITIPSVTVSDVQAEADEDGKLLVTWNYAADFEPTNWVVSCSYDSDLVPVTVSAKTNEVTISTLLPKTEYTITITTADGLPVSDVNASVTCTTPEAADYTGYGCSDPEMTLYVTEDNPESLSVAADTFTTSQHISFAVSASYDKTSEEKKADTTYIIRNRDGLPIAVYQSSRTWDGDWVKARHTGDLPDCIEQPGSYTLEIYFDGAFLASADFTVVTG